RFKRSIFGFSENDSDRLTGYQTVVKGNSKRDKLSTSSYLVLSTYPVPSRPSRTLLCFHYRKTIPAARLFRGLRRLGQLSLLTVYEDPDLEIMQGVSDALRCVRIDTIVFGSVPEDDDGCSVRSAILSMVKSHQTRAIEFTCFKGDTEPMCEFYIALADAGVTRVKVIDVFPTLYFRARTLWEGVVVQLSQESRFEFSVTWGREEHYSDYMLVHAKPSSC
ncbi:hypothetical protein PENTCL1PPCAC_4545, partial [Pristionchus entomophagus]